jgi:15-cis-phytoene synthase
MPEQANRAAADPVREAVQRGLPPGSPRHLAVLFAEPAVRAPLGALYAFEAELRRIVSSESHEPAHARLQWWRGELDRLAAGRPSHPIATALESLRDRINLDITLLHELLSAADLDLARFTYQSWQELDAYCFRSAGALQVLIAGLLADGRALSEPERQFARGLGTALRQAEILRDLSVDVPRGRLYAPLDALAATGIDPESMGHPGGTAETARFVAAWRERVRGQLQSLPSKLETPGQRRTQRHGLILAALQVRLVDRLDVGGNHPGGRLELEPFARLWIAWRTARRHA